MRKTVNGLLKEQEIKRNKLEEKFEAERREFGKDLINKKLNELRESLAKLRCEDLLDADKEIVEKIVVKEVPVEKIVEKIVEKEIVKEVPVEKIVEKIVEKEVVIEVPVEVVVEVPNNEAAEELAKCKKQLADAMAKCAKLEKQLAVKPEIKVDAKKEIKKEETKTDAKVDVKKEEKPEVKKENKPEIKKVEVKKEEVKVEETKKEEVKKEVKLIKCEKYKSKREDVTMYDGGNYYVMASTKCKQITVIPGRYDFEVTDDIVESYQKELINMGYLPNRTNVSPITVSHKEDIFKGYFARIDALEGVDKYSSKDVFAGYVYDGGRCILFTWDQSVHSKPAVYKLKESIEGRQDANYITDYEVARITTFVNKMFDIYKEEVAKVTAIKNIEIAKKAEIDREMAQRSAKRSEEFQAKVAASRASGKVLGSAKKNTDTKKKIIKKKDNKTKANYNNLADSMKAAAESF